MGPIISSYFVTGDVFCLNDHVCTTIPIMRSLCQVSLYLAENGAFDRVYSIQGIKAGGRLGTPRRTDVLSGSDTPLQSEIFRPLGARTYEVEGGAIMVAWKAFPPLETAASHECQPSRPTDQDLVKKLCPRRAQVTKGCGMHGKRKGSEQLAPTQPHRRCLCHCARTAAFSCPLSAPITQ